MDGDRGDSADLVKKRITDNDFPPPFTNKFVAGGVIPNTQMRQNGQGSHYVLAFAFESFLLLHQLRNKKLHREVFFRQSALILQNSSFPPKVSFFVVLRSFEVRNFTTLATNISILPKGTLSCFSFSHAKAPLGQKGVFSNVTNFQTFHKTSVLACFKDLALLKPEAKCVFYLTLNHTFEKSPSQRFFC